MTIPTMEEMLKGGVHFGHQASRWHPKMESYIYTTRNNVHILDLKKTASHLEKACDFLKKVTADGGDVLFVGTKQQAMPLIEKYASEAGMPYTRGRWMGGTLTNFKQIKLVIKKYLDLTKGRDSGGWDKYTKKEQVGLSKELEKLHRDVSGLASLTKAPAAVFVVDVRNEKTAVAEASVKGIPIVALCDTNVNPSKVDYVIPANDDAKRGLELLIAAAASACAEGVKARKVVTKKEEPKKAVAKKAAPKKAAAKKPAAKKETAKKAEAKA